MDHANMDKVARSTNSCVQGTFEEAKVFLGVTDDELSFLRPTVLTSVHELGDEYVGIALLSAMARVKGRTLKLVFGPGKEDDNVKNEIIVGLG